MRLWLEQYQRQFRGLCALAHEVYALKLGFAWHAAGASGASNKQHEEDVVGRCSL